MKATILILFLALAGFASAFHAVNDNFEGFLKGKTLASDNDILRMYETFLAEHRKGASFEANRDMDRFLIFRNNVRKIIAHNSNPDRTWDMGVNHLTDMTSEEQMEYYQVMEPQECSATASPRTPVSGEVPDSFDWRDQDMVSPVKDQQKCGSCWTFSTTGAMEAHYKIYNGEEVLLSEQELVDCPDAEKYDTHGCSGGLPSYAFNFIHDFGLETENDYPYRAHDHQCLYDESKERVTTDGPFNVTAGDEEQLKELIATVGPVSVAFQVVSDFMGYKSGVYSSADCKNTQQDVNHAVLAVGYGTEDGIDYWLVKNSWSESWGDEGYFKIQRGVNMCGIAMCNSYPTNVRRA
jgi:cathepsin H